MKSLVIVSLPRSLSTQVHALSCAALGLRSPSWTTAGEILNVDRSVLSAGRGTGLKFVTPGHGLAFEPTLDFLSAVIAPDGFAYKDVVQPFVMARWLRAHPGVPVLKIRPNIAHVALAMIGRHWLYPVAAGVQGASTHERLVSGLLHAAETLDAVPGESVAYDDLIFDFAPLWRALARLYPEAEIRPLGPGPDFGTYRDAILCRRHSDDYRGLEDLARTMRSEAEGALHEAPPWLARRAT